MTSHRSPDPSPASVRPGAARVPSRPGDLTRLRDAVLLEGPEHFDVREAITVGGKPGWLHHQHLIPRRHRWDGGTWPRRDNYPEARLGVLRAAERAGIPWTACAYTHAQLIGINTYGALLLPVGIARLEGWLGIDIDGWNMFDAYLAHPNYPGQAAQWSTFLSLLDRLIKP